MKYQVIYADPPWGYNNYREKINGAAAAHYPTLTDKALLDIPVGDLAEDDALLFLWATWPKLQEAMACMDAWGFKFVTAPFVWNKTTTKGDPHHGVGFWTPGSTEFVLLGRKGKGVPRRRDTRSQTKQLVNVWTESVIESPRGRHSAKPPEVRDKIIELVGDLPRIELFAREKVEGWDSTGLDLDGMDIRDFLSAKREA